MWQKSGDAAYEGPTISVIVPVKNGAKDLKRCLEALAASDYSPKEIIVVDDGSTDDSAEVATAAGARVIKLAHGQGAAAARNEGAAAASGEILFFIDADVKVAHDTVGKVASVFQSRPEVSAVIGSYTPTTPARGFFSQFKNIHHHYIHQISRDEAASFWTGCGAVRREVFFAVGGFDASRYGGATIEDIEFGYRLNRKGLNIFLAKDIQVTHWKKYTLWSLMRSDICYRAIPWTKLMLLRRHFRSDLNTTPRNALSVLLSAAIIAALATAPWRPVTLAAIPLLFAAFVFNTKDFNAYVKKHCGWKFAAATTVLSVWYFFYAGVGLLLGVVAALWELIGIRGRRS